MTSLFCRGWSDFDKISETGHWCRMTWRLRWCGRNRNQMYDSNTAGVWANSMVCHPRATYHIAGCCHLANSMSWFQSYVSHCSVLPPGEFSGMSSQSHVLHCRVLPLGEFTVTILEPHATLQGAVTWRNQGHDRAKLQGVRIPSVILKIVFHHILLYFFCFLCSLGFDERRLSYRLRYTCSTSNNSKTVQDRAIFTIESRIWSIERRHFQWPW